MTEKRFEMNVGVSNFTDNQTKRMYSEYNLEEIVDLLNEQHEEIKELQSELRFAKIEKEKLQDNIHITKAEMSKNILHLKEDFQYYKSKCASLEEGLFRQDREVSRLEKENKQLKKELEDWKSNCLSIVDESSILWNEIAIMREQGAKPSSAFEEYLDKISTKYTRFWKRKLNKAREDKVI